MRGDQRVMRIVKVLELLENEVIGIFRLHEEHDVRRNTLVQLLDPSNYCGVPQPAAIPAHNF